jgi:hypothetical protein
MSTRAMVGAAAFTLLSLALGGPPASASENRLLLFAGPDWKDFLGCINCRASNPYSIWNPASDYGSPTNPASIWNRKGEYGSSDAPASPWSAAPQPPPVVVDRVGNFCGYFVIDPSFPGRVKEPYLVWLLEGHAWAADHLEEVRADFENQDEATWCGAPPPSP